MTSNIMDQLEEVPPRDFGLITVDNDQLLISAVKKSERGDALIIRIYNGGSSLVENSSIFIGVKTEGGYLVTFNEEELSQLIELEDGKYAIPKVRPNSAVTLKFLVE